MIQIRKRKNLTYIFRFDFDELTTAAPDSTTTASLGKCTTDYFQVIGQPDISNNWTFA